MSIPRSRRIVHITTVPDSAEVLLDDVMVGNTPVDLPRPETGTQNVTLRMRGYQPTSVVISPQTGDTLNLTLDREHAAPSGRRRRPTPQVIVQPATTPVVQPPPRPRPRTTEVVDPWAQ